MKFKKGDMVRCKSGFLQGGPKDHKELAGGSGYKAGRIFIVNNIDEHKPPMDSVAWPNEGAGIFFRALELYFDTPLEREFDTPLERECNKIKKEIGL